MPWNDNNDGGKSGGNGPWGSGPRPPWGQPPRNQPPPQQGGPDLEDMLRRLNQRWRNPFGGGGGSGRGGGEGGGSLNWRWIGGLLAAGWVLSGVYMVDQREQAVVTQFGGYMGPPKGAGLHWHLPFPIQDVRIERVSEQRRTIIGRDDRNQEVLQEALMLTGDKNILDLNFTVVWQLKNIEYYVFNLNGPDEAVKAIAESAMREVVGRRELDDIITRERSQVEAETQELMQRVLDEYRSGVLVAQVQINQAAPPREVIDAFQDVIKAGQDQVTTRNEAERYRNERVPQARGQAAAQIQAAEAYREQVVREAEGEAARFASVLVEYKRAPGVTRQRLYIETMERVIGGAQKTIVDTRGSGVLPYLPLDSVRRAPAMGAAPAVTPPAQ